MAPALLQETIVFARRRPVSAPITGPERSVIIDAAINPVERIARNGSA